MSASLPIVWRSTDAETDMATALRYVMAVCWFVKKGGTLNRRIGLQYAGTAEAMERHLPQNAARINALSGVRTWLFEEPATIELLRFGVDRQQSAGGLFFSCPEKWLRIDLLDGRVPISAEVIDPRRIKQDPLAELERALAIGPWPKRAPHKWRLVFAAGGTPRGGKSNPDVSGD